MKRFVTETDDTGKSTTVTLPEYVNRICADNTAQAEQLVEYRDFMRDMCHALGMSLESTFADVLRRVEKLKVSSPSVPSERAVAGAEKGLYSVATAEDWAEKCNDLSVKLLSARGQIAELSGKLNAQKTTAAWAVEGRNELLEEYRADNAALSRRVDALNVKLGAKQKEIDALNQSVVRAQKVVTNLALKCKDLRQNAADDAQELKWKGQTLDQALKDFENVYNLYLQYCAYSQSAKEQLKEYRSDVAALNRQVEEYRSVAFGLWESLEKAKSDVALIPESTLQKIKQLEKDKQTSLYPGNWVEV